MIARGLGVGWRQSWVTISAFPLNVKGMSNFALEMKTNELKMLVCIK